jgi:uroporphyrinogen decarboxylase
MQPKERVLATMNHQPIDRTALDCWLYQKQFVQQLESEYGPREQFMDEFNLDIVIGMVPWPNQIGQKIEVEDLVNVDLGNPRDDKWLTHDSWSPDFACMNVMEAIEKHGHKRAVIVHFWGMLEGTSSYVGIENCWANLSLEPEKMTAWFDRYADWLCELSDSCIEAGADVMQMSDDWGSNQRMLFSPPMWRELIKPYAARVVQHIRGRDVPVNLHSDGHIMAILDDLIEMGITGLHPVQESAGMEPQMVKDKYGDKITVYGSLDVVDGLYGMDGDELDDYIRGRFEVYAPGGGFIFTTGHFVQPDIPVQRLIRAYTLANELAEKYGTA